jgi:hypothetical protein
MKRVPERRRRYGRTPGRPRPSSKPVPLERLEKTHLDCPATLEDCLTALAIGLLARAGGG